LSLGLIIGAGCIGRGFIAEILDKSGWDISFVNRSRKTVNELNFKGGYNIVYPNYDFSKKWISVKEAICIEDLKLFSSLVMRADIIFISVGASNLSNVAKLMEQPLNERLKKRKEAINIIVCENMRQSSEVFKSAINSQRLFKGENPYGVASAIIYRKVRHNEALGKEEPLSLLSGTVNTIPVDSKGLISPVTIKGIKPVNNIKAYEESKLYIGNASHAAAAYLGNIYGYNYIHESADNPNIMEVVEGIYEESSIAIKKKYGFIPNVRGEDRFDYLVKDFKQKNFPDPLTQVCREPIRKITPGERFVGGVRLVESENGDCSPFAKAIAAVLMYDYDKDEEAVRLQQRIRYEGVKWVLENITKINKEEKLFRIILRKYKYGFK
jgi:mannitol-1-phosphate 5-dehydrogenase